MIEILLSFLINIKTLEPSKSNLEPTQNILNTQIIKLDSSRPFLNGQAGLIADLNTDTILFQKNGLQKSSIASLTKLMTAYIIVSEHNLNEVVTINPQATNTTGSKVGIQPNQQLTVLDLLKALLIQSGNDAAIALAIYNAQTIENFVDKMNQYAKEINLQNTNFQNPMGFDHQLNYSTPQDLYTLAKAVYKFPEIQNIVQTKNATIYTLNTNTPIELISTNLILDSYLQIGGLKTGTTSQAGGCFIGITTNTPNPQIAIILGSNDRFLDTKVMLDWAQNTFKYN
jgi:D-alanyl-D-alanine carboxypeptidase (penicillin-binding protein 5/6)